MLIAPNSINWISLTTGGAGYNLIYMEYLSLSTDGIVNPDGSVAPLHSISDWESHNANYTQWSFNIKPGMKWSDGTPVTSQDILATFSPRFYYNRTVADPFGWSQYVKNLVADNSSEATFYLTQPEPLWSAMMGGEAGYGPVYPAETINKYGNEFLNFGTVVADGPFFTANYSAGQTTMTLLRNPYFQPQPTVCEIDVNFVESLALTSTYLKSSTTDVAPVEWSNIQSALSNPNYHLFDQKGFDMTTLQYNDSIYPYNMTNFRQALAYAIDQQTVVNDAFNGYGIPGYSGQGDLSPIVTRWYNPNQVKYSLNPSQATSLLSAIGIKKGSDGHLQYRNGTDVTLTIWTDTDTTADLTAQSDVQKDLQNLGFIVNVQSSSEANIIGYYNSNQQRVRSSMLLYTATNIVMTPGETLFAVLPGWDYYFGPVFPNHHWVWPPSVDTQWYGNESAFLADQNDTARLANFNTMQAIAAQYLPTIVLAYPDDVFAYNSITYTGWPTHGVFDIGAGAWNFTAIANLGPIAATTSSTSSTASSASSSTASSATSVTNSTTSSVASPAGVSTSLLAVAAIVIIVIVVAGAVALRARRPKG
jgi:peptide/nickel transport system substrate-binding protein